MVIAQLAQCYRLAVDSSCATRAVAAAGYECSLESNVHLLISQMPRLLPDRSMQQRTEKVENFQLQIIPLKRNLCARFTAGQR